MYYLFIIFRNSHYLFIIFTNDTSVYFSCQWNYCFYLPFVVTIQVFLPEI